MPSQAAMTAQEGSLEPARMARLRGPQVATASPSRLAVRAQAAMVWGLWASLVQRPTAAPFSLSRATCSNSVFTQQGHTAVTFTPLGASSQRRARV